MAMQSGIMPPSLNYDNPDPQMEMEEWGFRVPCTPEEWPQPQDQPRRLMVNAFGFGGANYVVHLEENLEGETPVLISIPEPTTPEEHLPLEDKAHQVNGICFLRGRTGDATFRISVLADNDQEGLKKASGLKPLEVATPLSDKDRRKFERQGIFLGQENQPEPPMALVFAGQGTYYAGMGKELYDNFPPIKLWMDRMAEVADFDLLHLLFYSRDENLQRTLWQQPALFTLNYSVVRYLLDLGLVPAAMAGHSLGELVALSVAGVFSYEDGFRIVHKRAQCMDKAGDIQGDPGTMVAVNVPLDILEEKVAARENVYFTNYNSPRQIVLGGGTKEVLAFKDELSGEGYWTYPLKVSMAFHSPIMRVIRDEMQAFVDTVTFHAPQIPVISNTTKKPYPDDPAEIKRIIMSHLESPVHWLQNVQTLWNDFGVRTFVEVGPKDTLCNLVTETVPEAFTMPTCDPEGEALTFRNAAARLFALGYFPAVKPLTTMDLSPAPAAPAPRPAAPVAPMATTSVAAIIQREINAFVLGSFGKYLKPAILEALRREVNPAFTETELDQLLGDGISSAPAPALAAPARAAAPIPQPSSAPVAPAPATAPEAPPAAPGAPLSPEDYLERIIQIIMDATGYERDEIEPDMDLRQDLAIRSSRLPVIMDAAEREFRIAIRIDDFLGVRTVQDLAERLAEVVARERARLVLVGVAELSLTRKAFWEKELTFTVSKAAGPGSLQPLYEARGFDYPLSLVRWSERRNLAAFLDLVARARVRVDRLITHRFPIDQGLEAYDLILKNREPYIGVVLNYPQPDRPETGEALADADKAGLLRKVWLKPAASPGQSADPRAMGLIGGGMFAKNILLPVLKKVPGLMLVGAATTTGVSARHIAKKFGFAYATADYREILQDKAIGSVIITTRHNSHAPLVLAALSAGKHVLVEKPLCLTEEELKEISAAYDGSRLLMVGFNRRFAPLARQVKAMVGGRTTPLMMTYRVNAGYIPGDHWVHDPEVGGGRLRGEVCHFIDFLHYFSGSPAVQVSVVALSGVLGQYRRDDNFILSLTFQDGSVGNIIYTAKGTKSFSRERFEVFGEESVAVIEDFRRGLLVQGGRSRSLKKLSMDLGYRGEMEFFSQNVQKGSDYDKIFEQYIASSEATLTAALALTTGETQRIKFPA
jgi:predicted dehydrogenase/malonyl CoA-acyl carrier protein transacylase/acyl carrier protein